MKIMKLLLIIYVLFTITAHSTPPRTPKTVIVSDSLKYIDIVLESDFFKSLEKWKLTTIAPPYYYDYNDSVFYVNLNFEYLQNINDNDFIFHISLISQIKNGAIVNVDGQEAKYFEIIESIESAIQDSTVLFFIKTTQINTAECFGLHIEFSYDKNNKLSYRHNPKGVWKLRWQYNKLIDSLPNYINLNHIIGTYSEFKKNLGIDVIEVNHEKVVLHSADHPINKKGMFSYIPGGRITYSLPCLYEWKKTLFYEHISSIVRDNLFIDSLSDCNLRRIRIDWRDKYPGNRIFYNVSFGIKCSPTDRKRTSGSMVLYADSTFEDLKIRD